MIELTLDLRAKVGEKKKRFTSGLPTLDPLSAYGSIAAAEETERGGPRQKTCLDRDPEKR